MRIVSVVDRFGAVLPSSRDGSDAAFRLPRERTDWLTGDAGRADPETPMQARLGRKKVAKFGEKSNEAGAAAAPRAENFPWCAHPRP